MASETELNATLARALLREARSAALATLDAEGAPFASYVLTAPAQDGSPLLLLSRLAVHTRNLELDPRASLLVVREPEAGSESMTALRLTVGGRISREEDSAAIEIYIARHPDAARYAGFVDFSLFRLDIEAGHLVAGFGRIASLSAANLVGKAPE